jgi:membrane-associated phospholipid phosphatase
VPIVFYAGVVLLLPRKRFMFPVSSVSPRVQLWMEINAWALIQIQALMLHLLFVETMKIYAGRLRPDFIDRLRVFGGITPNLGDTTMQYFCDTIQVNTNLREGRLSFPSGHSSTSFGSMVPVCLFLVFHLRPWFFGCIFRLVGCLLPLYLAFFVAVSRTRDNRHHFADIFAGSVIGVFAGLGAFWLNLRYSSGDGYFDTRSTELEEGLEPELPPTPINPNPHAT